MFTRNRVPISARIDAKTGMCIHGVRKGIKGLNKNTNQFQGGRGDGTLPPQADFGRGHRLSSHIIQGVGARFMATNNGHNHADAACNLHDALGADYVAFRERRGEQGGGLDLRNPTRCTRGKKW